MSGEDPVPAEEPAAVFFRSLTLEQQYLFTKGLHTSLRKSKTLLGLGGFILSTRRRAAREITEHKARIRATFQEVDEELRKIREELAQQGVDVPPPAKGNPSTITIDDAARFDFVDRIHPDAQELFVDDSLPLQGQFIGARTCEAFVMAMDLRRSTDLMLKARSTDLFVSFIAALSGRLREIILDHHGVFDKFTGDGILAFFPAFYTGPDGFHVVVAAEEAHGAFETVYKDAHSSFYTVLSPKEVGLGIGIDHGTVSVVVIGETVTIVGPPVVYACRLAGAPAGTTLVNQPAYEKLSGNKACAFTEERVQIKHEGESVAHAVRLSGQAYTPQLPAWRALAKPRTVVPPAS